MKQVSCDFLIIGAGIIGVSVAAELKVRYPETKIILLEKEPAIGLHASGRNSGVLHAGFYYTSDSLKAKFTRTGNIQLTDFCESRKLKINKIGKLVVAQNEKDLLVLDELLKRAIDNDVPLHDIDEVEAKKIEPRVKTYQRALYSPTTSTVDPIEVIKAMQDDIVSQGVQIDFNVTYLKKDKQQILTTKGIYESNYLINAAGLYADKIAKNFGFSQNYRILPFKGIYIYSNEQHGALATNIYPVPNLDNPFLGVHFTINVNGNIKLGPTAIPAFWREQYQGFSNFKINEFMETLLFQSSLLYRSDFSFKKLAIEEIKKYYKPFLVKKAAALVDGIESKNYKKWGKAGIRAQLVNIKDKKMEMDFILEGDKQSMHVLNAVSPGFTCALPFSKYICDKIEELI